ncbi:MAG TPA: hypothetical protein VLE69_00370 [Candidatus Saccharimonadales bacterium]|nr:hypothetical protein [Candidatus Saccharimonadales bacterium]
MIKMAMVDRALRQPPPEPERRFGGGGGKVGEGRGGDAGGGVTGVVGLSGIITRPL